MSDWKQLMLYDPKSYGDHEITKPVLSWDGSDFQPSKNFDPDDLPLPAPAICDFCQCTDSDHALGKQCYCGCTQYRGAQIRKKIKKFEELRQVFLAHHGEYITLGRAIELVKMWDSGKDISDEILRDIRGLAK